MTGRSPWSFTPESQRRAPGAAGVRRANGLLLRGYIQAVYYKADESDNLPKDPVTGVLCDVLIIEQGYRGTPLNRVPVMCATPAGFYDFAHHEPRPIAGRAGGGSLVTTEGSSATPLHETDGDLCVVGFLGDNLNNPVIVGFLPHPASEHGFSSDQGYRRWEQIAGNRMSVDKDGKVSIDITDGSGELEVVADGATITVKTDGTVVIDGAKATIRTAEASTNVQPVLLQALLDDLGTLLVEWYPVVQLVAALFGITLANSATIVPLLAAGTVNSAGKPLKADSLESD